MSDSDIIRTVYVAGEIVEYLNIGTNGEVTRTYPEPLKEDILKKIKKFKSILNDN